jgi:hypothetical protein
MKDDIAYLNEMARLIKRDGLTMIHYGAIGSLGNGIPMRLGTARAGVVDTGLSAKQVVKDRET